MSGGARKKPTSGPGPKARQARPRKGKASARGNRSNARQFAPVAVGMDSIQGGLYQQGAKSQRVRHTEFVDDIDGTAGFSTVAYAINPGQADLFPWLSKIASRYEKFVMHDLSFVYVTEKSSATNGTVILAVDYDASDDAPSSKAQLLQNEDKERVAPWQKMTLRCSKHNLKDTLARFIRPGALPGGADIKTYDLGTLYVGTSGMADTSPVGELYVQYDIELQTPVLEESGAAFNNNIYTLATVNKQSTTNNTSFQVRYDWQGSNPDSDYYSVSPAGDITLPGGIYHITGWVEVNSNTPNSLTGAALDLKKNAVTVYNTGGTFSPSSFDATTNPATGVTLPLSGYVAVKTGDVVSVAARGTVSAGYVDIQSYINIVAQ